MVYIGRGIGVNALFLNIRSLPKTNCSKMFLSDAISISNLHNTKIKSLINIRQLWLKKIYPEKDFCWNDNGKDFFICYDGKTFFDFNRDFLFDFLHEKQKYYIQFEGKFIEVNKPDFQTMRAVDLNGTKYHWDGSNWVKQP